MTVNFDNAATTFPKPESVKRAVNDALSRYGGNAGRGGHRLSAAASEAVYSMRETVGFFFGAEPENTVLTPNCTYALNMAIRGVIASYGGGHLIISSLEHNSVSRPAAALAAKGQIRLSVARVYPDNAKTVASFRELIQPDTRAVVCTAASNVTGQLLPVGEIASLCSQRGICFITDGAQTCGVRDIRLGNGINIICTSGHKGLYGITGTGLLVTDGKYPIVPIIQGGTGSASADLEQPSLLPEALESGTLNIIGAVSVKAGIDFISKTGTDRIFDHEDRICRRFISELSADPRITVYRSPEAEYAPIVSFNIEGIPSESAAAYLSEQGYCLRAGLHCAALAHKTLGTAGGTVRFSPSVFSRESDAVRLAGIIRKIERKNFEK